MEVRPPFDDSAKDIAVILHAIPADFRSDAEAVARIYTHALDQKNNLPSADASVRRRDLLSIAAYGTLEGKDINYPLPGPYKRGNEYDKRIALLWIYAENPDLAKAIIGKEVIGLHGSRSGTLMSILDKGFVPLASLRDQGILITSGERVVPGPIQETTSFVQWFQDAIRYYADEKDPITIASLEKIICEKEKELAKDLKRKRVSNRQRFTQSIQNTARLLDELKEVQSFLQTPPRSDEDKLLQELIQENFPIVSGIIDKGIPAEHFRTPYSSIPGEFTISGGVPKENIPLLLVPQTKLSRIKDLIIQKGTDITVFPLEHLLGK